MIKGGRRSQAFVIALVSAISTVALAAAAAGPRAGEVPGHRYEIEIRGMEFHPAELVVQPGDTVVWINRDIVPHTATRPSHWDTGTLTQGQIGRYIARSRGKQPYACTLHPTMTGQLIVR